jgi:hypothetical protein
MRLADLLWAKDHKRAGSLFNEATAILREVAGTSDELDSDFYSQQHLIPSLRQEMLNVAAKHDPRLALDFLRSTRSKIPTQPRYGRGNENIEGQLEFNVAMQIADREPAEAVRIAADALKHGVDYHSVNLLQRFQTQNNGTAEKFVEEIVGRLRGQDFNENPTSLFVIVYLLNNWADHSRIKADPARGESQAPRPLLSDATAKELADMILRVLTTEQNRDGSVSRSIGAQANSVIQQIKPLMPEIEKLPGLQLEQLRKRIQHMEQFQETYREPWPKYQELMQNGTVEALVEASKKAPEFADSFLQQAMWKALNEGNDIERARAVVDLMSNPRQRAEMRLSLSRQLFYRAHTQQKLVEARNLLSEIHSIEEKGNLLMQLAGAAEVNGNKAFALELLSEAESLFPERAQNYNQLNSQLQMSRAYDKLDAAKSLAILEKAISQLNELAGAALILNGFDIPSYFRDGELLVNSGTSLSSTTQEVGRQLHRLAGEQFDRAKSLAETFQRRELRIIAILEIAQGAITENLNTANSSQPSTSIVSFGRGFARLIPLVNPGVGRID